jgi:hypothetical protein
MAFISFYGATALSKINLVKLARFLIHGEIYLILKIFSASINYLML